MHQMKSCHEIWNVLHDGSIVGVAGGCPGALSIKVEIPYLCNVISKGTSFLWVHLYQCRKATYTPDDSSEPMPDLQSLPVLEVEILSASERGDGVSIRCTDGVLDLSYAGASYELEGRVAIDFPAISTACHEYWDDWERENAAARRR